MAIIFKKKPTPVQPIAPTTEVLAKETEEMSERQLNALAAVGLAPEPKKSITINKPEVKKSTAPVSNYKGLLAAGTKVKICFSLFDWVETYKVGDTGVILRDWATVMPPGASQQEKEDYHLYEIQLDNPRIPSKPTVLVRSWELEVLK